MKRLVLTFAATAGLALSGSAAFAATGHGGHHGGRGGSASYAMSSYGGYGGFQAAAQMVKDRHSRDRYYTHPRSYYNAPSRGVKYYPGGYGYYGGRSGGSDYGYYNRSSRGRSYGHHYYERGCGSYYR